MALAATVLKQDLCPWCDSPISHDKFVEIEERIRGDEEKKFKELQKQMTAQREAAEKKVKAEIDQLKQKSEEQKEALEKAKAEKQQLEKTTKATLEAAVAKAQAEAAKTRHAELAKIRDESAKLAQAEATKVRNLLKSEYDKKSLKDAADRDREKQALNKKLFELQRKLDAQTANALGEGAEVDVYEALKEAFASKGDESKRVPKGVSGPDIIHRVNHNGVSCGVIVIDSKNRQSWQDNYVTKLKDDKIEAKADYAILATTVFPKGAREFLAKDHVILVNPGRVVEIVRVLRQVLIRLNTAKLSNQQRAEKQTRLYEYISSEAYRQKFAETGALAKGLLELDVEEKGQHERMWKKRGASLRKMENVVSDVETEISAIVSGPSRD